MHSFIFVDLIGFKDEFSILYSMEENYRKYTLNQLTIKFLYDLLTRKCFKENQVFLRSEMILESKIWLALQALLQLSYFKPIQSHQQLNKLIIHNISMTSPLHSTFVLLAICCVLNISISKCVYKVHEDGRPEKVDAQPHLVQNLTQCIQYNGKLGCCDLNNDAPQVNSYREIDGIFGSQGGGCDICAINLKRFWCQYACSPRQSDFLEATQQFYPYPDPKNPNNTVMVQKVNLTVHADAACSLYNSCKRIGFVSSVSAMSTPAGFLNFQGHNAIDDAYQYINVNFSYSSKNSLYFNDQKKQTEPERAAFQLCNFTSPKGKVHGFQFMENCTCNNCEDTCNQNSGFVYSEPQVFQGFNWILVCSTWIVSILVAGLVSFWRRRVEKQKSI